MSSNSAQLINLGFQAITVAGVMTIVIYVVKIAIRWGEISTLVKQAMEDVKQVAEMVKNFHFALSVDIRNHGKRLTDLERAVGKLEGKNGD